MKGRLIPVKEASKEVNNVVSKPATPPSSTKGQLSQKLIQTTGKNPHIQHYHVKGGEVAKAVKKRSEILSKFEKAFGKPLKDFAPHELKLLEKETSQLAINSLVANKADYVISGMTRAALPTNKKFFERTLTLKEEGEGVTIYSPTSRAKGEKKEENPDYDPNKPTDVSDDNNPINQKNTKIINVYTHKDPEGNVHEETLFEHHKRIKDGGATDEEVKNYGMLLLDMAEKIGAGVPDMIITPPVTGVDSEGKPLSFKN